MYLAPPLSVTCLFTHCIHLVFIFLEDTENIDKFSKRLVKVSKQHNDECKELLKYMGIPYIEVQNNFFSFCFQTFWICSFLLRSWNYHLCKNYWNTWGYRIIDVPCYEFIPSLFSHLLDLVMFAQFLKLVKVVLECLSISLLQVVGFLRTLQLPPPFLNWPPR